MAAEYWIVVAVAIVAALVAGFMAGRMSAPRQRHMESMRQERDQARKEAEEVRTEVNRHFEESARMFGKLASDYRSFFQQFARTAQNLGLSEGQARSLLQQADPSLVAHRPNGAAAPATDAADDRTAVPRGAAAAVGTDATPGPQAAPAHDRSEPDRREGKGRDDDEVPGRTEPTDDGTPATEDTERRA